MTIISLTNVNDFEKFGVTLTILILEIPCRNKLVKYFQLSVQYLSGRCCVLFPSSTRTQTFHYTKNGHAPGDFRGGRPHFSSTFSSTFLSQHFIPHFSSPAFRPPLFVLKFYPLYFSSRTFIPIILVPIDNMNLYIITK